MCASAQSVRWRGFDALRIPFARQRFGMSRMAGKRVIVG